MLPISARRRMQNFSRPVVAHFDEAALGLQQWFEGIQGAVRRQMRSEMLARLRRSLGESRTASLGVND